MKITIFTLFISAAMLSCSDNANVRVQLSPAGSELVSGTKIYAGYSFSVFRIYVDGKKYLVNSQGGIIEELTPTHSPKPKD